MSCKRGIKVPSRDDHVLDLVIASDHSVMSELQVVESFSTRDHFMVEFSLILGHHDNWSNSPAAVYYDYENADYDGIVSHLLNDCGHYIFALWFLLSFFLFFFPHMVWP